MQGAISNPVARPAEPSKSGRLSPGALPSPEPDRGCPPLPFHVSLLRGQPRAWASGPGARKKAENTAAGPLPFPLKIAPSRGRHAFRRAPGAREGVAGRATWPAGRPSGTGWGRGRAPRSAGRHVALLRGALAAWAARCARMMESFWNFLQLESAAGRGSRPSAAREGAPSRPTPGRVSAAPVVVADFPARSRTSPGRGRRLPSPAAPSGLAGVQARPSRPGRRTGARCRRRPSPSRLVSLSARHLCKSHQPCGLLGRGRGRRRRHRGRPGSSRGSGGKTRERIPPAASPAPPARAEPSKGSPVGGRRGSPLSASPPLLSQRPSQWAADRWKHPGSFPQRPQQLALRGHSEPCRSESPGKGTPEGGPPFGRSPEIQGSW